MNFVRVSGKKTSGTEAHDLNANAYMRSVYVNSSRSIVDPAKLRAPTMAPHLESNLKVNARITHSKLDNEQLSPTRTKSCR